jgi:hypothetical protein
MKISVIIPLPDHRGMALACIESWVQTQRYSREKYEVLVVANGTEPALEQQVKAILSEYDSLIYEDSPVEMALYDTGARQARGEFLFFTESHCLGDPNCLQEITNFLIERAAVGALCRSEDLSTNWLAALEECLAEDRFKVRSQPDHWYKTAVRGFAIRRELYLAQGGFEAEFGLFAEPLLSARLHSQGYRLSYAEKAVIYHYNTTRLTDLLGSVRDYTYGECAYHAKFPDNPYAQYLGWAPEWSERESYRPETAWALCQIILKQLPTFFHSKNNALLSYALSKAALRLAPIVLFGSGWLLFQARFALTIGQLQLWLYRFHAQKSCQIYRDYWENKLVRLTRLEFIASYLQETQPDWEVLLTYDLARLGAEHLLGFYPVETYQGQTFRWSTPTALVRVSLPAQNYKVVCRMLAVRAAPSNLLLFFDGCPITNFTLATDQSAFSFEIKRAMFKPDNNTHDLVLFCPPLGSRELNGPDRRDLGLPIKLIEFYPAESNSDDTNQ